MTQEKKKRGRKPTGKKTSVRGVSLKHEQWAEIDLKRGFVPVGVYIWNNLVWNQLPAVSGTPKTDFNE